MKNFFNYIKIIFLIKMRFLVSMNLLKANFIIENLEKIIHDLTGENLHLTQIPRLFLIPLQVHFDEISLKHQEHFSLSVTAGLLHLEFFPLFKGKIVFNLAQFEQASLHLGLKEGQEHAYIEQKALALPNLKFEVSKLKIINAKVIIPTSKSQSIEITELNADVSNFKINDKSKLSLNMLMNVSEQNLIGKVHFNGDIIYSQHDFAINVDALQFQHHLNMADVYMIEILANSNLKIVMDQLPKLIGQINIKQLNLTPFLMQKNANKQDSKTSMLISPFLDLELNIENTVIQQAEFNDLYIHAKGDANSNYSFKPVHLSLVGGGKLEAAGNLQVPSMNLHGIGTFKEVNLRTLLNIFGIESPAESIFDFDFDFNAKNILNGNIFNELTGIGIVQSRKLTFKQGIVIPATSITQGFNLKEFTEVNAPFSINNDLIDIKGAHMLGEGVEVGVNGEIHIFKQRMNLIVKLKTLKMEIPIFIAGLFTNFSYGIDPSWFKKALLKFPSIIGHGASNIGVKAGGAVVDVLNITVEGSKSISKGAGSLLKNIFKF